MSSQYVLQQLATLDISKATGLDNISAKFLKMSSHLISIPLCQILYLSIRKSNFPSTFKLAKVIPVSKNKGSRNDVSNYRPIAIFPLGNNLKGGGLRLFSKKIFRFPMLLKKIF